MAWVAVGVGAASLVGGVISANAAGQAADEQANAAQNAQNLSEREFNTITSQEEPWMVSGTAAQAQLNYLLGEGQAGTTQGNGLQTAASSNAGGFGSLIAPFTTQNFQQLSPAYNFQKQQGQQNVLNSDAAGQGSLSGAALKDLTDYNQSMANTSFNNAFNQYQTQQGNIFSRLSGISQLGQNAAANTGQQGTALAGQAAQSATNIGTAQAGGTVGAANAISSGLSNAALPWLINSTSTPSSADGTWV